AAGPGRIRLAILRRPSEEAGWRTAGGGPWPVRYRRDDRSGAGLMKALLETSAVWLCCLVLTVACKSVGPGAEVQTLDDFTRSEGQSISRSSCGGPVQEQVLERAKPVIKGAEAAVRTAAEVASV